MRAAVLYGPGDVRVEDHQSHHSAGSTPPAFLTYANASALRPRSTIAPEVGPRGRCGSHAPMIAEVAILEGIEFRVPDLDGKETR